jgi:hypothetical protein
MPEDDVEFVGPFDRWDLVVGGRVVPYLEGRPRNGGRILFLLDGRFGMEVDLAEAERWAPFLAHCIAVAAGYTAHPTAGDEGPRPRHPFPRSIALDES